MLRRPSVRLGMVALLLLMVGAGVGYWYYAGIFAGTDDAYVTGHVGVVSPRVPGRVIEVQVDNNYLVQPGQALVVLDPTDYRVAVAQAEAHLNRLRQDMNQLYVRVSTVREKIAQAEANYREAEIDHRRYTNLFERRTIPRQALDRADTRFRVTRAKVNESKRELEEALATIGGATSIPLAEQPALKEAKARLDQARLNLEYTRVKAEVRGYITKRQVQPGNWAQAGQPLMMLVPLDTPDLWIQANFKETQLAHVYLGQPVTVKVDAYPGTVFKGRVDSIMAGTGSAFSLLPPENATGNWVKVVQRVPVKITLLPPFPENLPLRLGMSTETTIDTRQRTGARLLAHAVAGGQ